MITANELKTRGIKAIEENLNDHNEVGITVHGKVKFVAMTVEQYDLMRAAELDAAYSQVMMDIDQGNYKLETAQQHIKRLVSQIEKKLKKNA